MDQIRILGGKPLSGTIHISGAKNAALPLMAASLLTAETIRLSNLPHLADISTMTDLLAQLGVEIRMDGLAGNGGHAGRVLSLRAGAIAGTTAPYDLVRTMRASVLVLGPLLARAGRARVSLPGGCAIGNRPVDLHLRALSELGAEIELVDGYIDARAPKGLRGAEVVFPQVSVGATENALMAAALAEGETVLANAAREPGNGVLAVWNGAAPPVIYTDADVDTAGLPLTVIRQNIASVDCRVNIGFGSIVFGQFGQDSGLLVQGGCERNVRGEFYFGSLCPPKPARIADRIFSAKV